MNRKSQQSIASDLAAVLLARLVAGAFAFGFAIRGDWLGAGVMAAVVVLLWLAKPVTIPSG